MARYTASIPTSRSVEDAFAYMADVSRFAQWDPGIERAVQVAGAGPGVGAAYDLTVRTIGTTVMRYEVVEYQAPRRFLLVSRTSLLVSHDEIRVAPAAGGAAGSIVTYDAKLTLHGPLRLFDPLLRWWLRRIGDRAMAGLRDHLAGGPPN
jgi:Polyketide cyclase / dehydrase and lipid transport